MFSLITIVFVIVVTPRYAPICIGIHYSDYYCEGGVTSEINFNAISSLINILEYFFRRNTYEIMVLYH